MKKPMLVVAMLAMVAAVVIPALAKGSTRFQRTSPSYPRVLGERETSNDWGWHYGGPDGVYYPGPNGTQLLYFEDIANIPDPCVRFAAEEAKRQEILYSWPGVKYAAYNGLDVMDDRSGRRHKARHSLRFYSPSVQFRSSRLYGVAGHDRKDAFLSGPPAARPVPTVAAAR